jgi:hypothetical protein
LVRARTVLLGLVFLLGCAADGTDYEAYPFFANDATKPGVTRLTIPVALSSYDEGEPRDIRPARSASSGAPGRERRMIRGVEVKPGENEPPTPMTHPEGQPVKPEELRASRLQVLFPIVSLETEHKEHEFNLFAPLIVPFTTAFFSGVAGPVGRAVTGTTPTIAYPSSVFGTTAPGQNPLASLPVFGFDRVHTDPAAPTETKHDFGLWPLVLGGSWPLTGSYLTIAPFGGTTQGFLGKDEMTWVGFPYPFYLYTRERDYESRHVLWPFVNWVEGAGHEGFRIWPFYAHYRRTDLLGREAYDRHWVMWPFVSWARNSGQQGTYEEDEETGEGHFLPTPTEELFIFPFYGQIIGPDSKNYSVLWPFFRYEEVPSANFWELRALFPIVTIHHGDDPVLARAGQTSERFRFDVWPIAGYRTRPGYLRHFFIWPVERYEARDDEWAEDTKFFFVPFLTWHHHIEKETKQDYQHTRAWPFFLYRRGAKPEDMDYAPIQFHALCPILWDDPNGFERIIFPFFRLYSYERTARGASQHRFLFGLASWRHDPGLEGVSDGYSRLSLLFGLFQVRSGGLTPEESPRSGFRMFFLPEISWGGRS